MKIMRKRILRIALALVMTLGIVAGATTTMSKDVDAACGHWSYHLSTVQTPNCKDAGIYDAICDYCGQRIGGVVTSPNGQHNWQRITTVSPASCTRSGVNYCRCTRCGTSSHVTVPATGHTYHVWYEGTRFRAVCIFCGYDASDPIVYV